MRQPGPEALRERAVADGGQPVQVDGEEDDQQDGHPEVGHAETHKGREGEGVVEGAVSFDGGDDAGGDRQQERDDKGEDRQRHGAGKGLGDDAAHRDVATVKGVAEVASEDLFEPQEILYVDGPVEAELAVELFRGRRIPDIEEHRLDGIARDGPQHEKDQRGHRPHDDEGVEAALDEVDGHSVHHRPSAVRQR